MNEQAEPQTLQEMEARRDQLEEEIASVKSKLENVRAKRHTTGVYADPDWYRRAMTRLRFSTLEKERLVRKIAETKRAQRKDHAASVERAFVGIAKERLDAVEFDTIMAKAQALATA